MRNLGPCLGGNSFRKVLTVPYRLNHRAAELLLIDDNPADAFLVEAGLNEVARKKFHLNVANDGDEALKFLRQWGEYEQSPRPDLILLDLNLPTLHGTEVLTVLKKDESLRLIPVLIYTSSGAPGDVSASYRCGANGYIRKPMILDDIFDIVRTLEHYWFDLSALPA